MVSALNLVGIRAALRWESRRSFSVSFSIYVFELLEFLLEYARFSVEEVSVKAEDGGVLLALSSGAALFPSEVDELPPPDGCRIERAWQSGTYRVRITERGGADA
jgi:hypothetical protein